MILLYSHSNVIYRKIKAFLKYPKGIREYHHPESGKEDAIAIASFFKEITYRPSIIICELPLFSIVYHNCHPIEIPEERRILLMIFSAQAVFPTLNYFIFMPINYYG